MAKYVTFEETGEVRFITAVCSICQAGSFKPDLMKEPQVVSPTGRVHEGMEGGRTWCGRDATGPKWWWKL